MPWLGACLRWLSAVAGAALFLAGANAALAGQLILKNTSNAAITCTVDGWTTSSGASFTWYVQVQPNVPFYVGQNTQRAGDPIINWAQCGGLPATRQMNITPTGPDQTLVLNGQQTRVLNVSLYPYLPTLPTDNFEGLVAHVVQTYQAQNPQVLLNAVLNQNVNIYSFTELPQLLSAQGFDVIELDTLYLGFLADSGLINPAQITGEQPLPVAINAASYQGQLYGIPSWLCMDFIYSASSAIQQQTSLSQLLQFLGTQPSNRPELVGTYNGSWRLPSIYINGYVQTYGYGQIAQSMQMPPNNTVIGNLVSLSNTCAYQNVNNCTNDYYHNQPNGATEQVFATGQASSDMGFSEQSFFVNLYGPITPLYVTPAPWGQTPQPLLFSDAFVSNKATCASATPCAADATAFTTLMTGVAMKNYIVESQDLPPGTPWRTLLVSNAGFWAQPQIMNNALYQQYSRVFATAQPFPNTFTAALQASMGSQICAALKAQQPAFVCKTASAAAVKTSAQTQRSRE